MYQKYKQAGGFIRAIRACEFIQDIWVKIITKLNAVFNTDISMDPVCLLLGVSHPQINGTHNQKLLSVLASAAHRTNLTYIESIS